MLLAVDQDEDRAKNAAQAVSELPGDVEAVILNVFEEFDASDGDGRVTSSELYDDEDHPDSVIAAEQILADAGVTTTKRREHGDPTEVILAVAEELDVDSIALSAEKRSPVGKAVFGSVTQSVLLSSDRPVIVATTN